MAKALKATTAAPVINTDWFTAFHASWPAHCGPQPSQLEYRAALVLYGAFHQGGRVAMPGKQTAYTAMLLRQCGSTATQHTNAFHCGPARNMNTSSRTGLVISGLVTTARMPSSNNEQCLRFEPTVKGVAALAAAGIAWPLAGASKPVKAPRVKKAPVAKAPVATPPAPMAAAEAAAAIVTGDVPVTGDVAQAS
jgi:hypothetical protein